MMTFPPAPSSGSVQTKLPAVQPTSEEQTHEQADDFAALLAASFLTGGDGAPSHHAFASEKDSPAVDPATAATSSAATAPTASSIPTSNGSGGDAAHSAAPPAPAAADANLFPAASPAAPDPSLETAAGLIAPQRGGDSLTLLTTPEPGGGVPTPSHVPAPTLQLSTGRSPLMPSLNRSGMTHDDGGGTAGPALSTLLAQARVEMARTGGVPPASVQLTAATTTGEAERNIEDELRLARTQSAPVPETMPFGGQLPRIASMIRPLHTERHSSIGKGPKEAAAGEVSIMDSYDLEQLSPHDELAIPLSPAGSAILSAGEHSAGRAIDAFALKIEALQSNRLRLGPEVSAGETDTNGHLDADLLGAGGHTHPSMVTIDAAPVETIFAANHSGETSAQPILRQTIDSVLTFAADLARRETRTLRLRLNPEELGQIDIRISCDHEGRLSAHLTTEHETAHRALSEGIGHLREALAQAGLAIERLDVSVGSDAFAAPGGHPDDTSRGDRTSSASNLTPYISSAFNDEQPAIDTARALRDRLLSMRA